MSDYYIRIGTPLKELLERVSGRCGLKTIDFLQRSARYFRNHPEPVVRNDKYSKYYESGNDEPRRITNCANPGISSDEFRIYLVNKLFEEEAKLDNANRKRTIYRSCLHPDAIIANHPPQTIEELEAMQERGIAAYMEEA